MHQCCFIFNVDDIDAMFDIDEASQTSRALLAMSRVRNAQRLAARTAAQRKAVQQGVGVGVGVGWVPGRGVGEKGGVGQVQGMGGRGLGDGLRAWEE